MSTETGHSKVRFRIGRAIGGTFLSAVYALALSACGGGGGGGGGAFVSPSPPSPPSPPTCSSNELLIGSTCVTKKVCPAGQVLDETNNTCSNRIYWSQLQSHEYVSGVDSPHQQAFSAAEIASKAVDRSSDAHILHAGASSQARNISDFLARLGAAGSQFTFKQLGASPGAAQVAADYRSLTDDDFVNLSHSAFPFITDADNTNSGISTSQVRQGAWMLLDTGSGGSQDPFQNLAQHYQDGAKAAATGGKLHFYYGLNPALTGRHPSANGCKGIKDYCIGAPYSFRVQLRDSTSIDLPGASSTFAFAAYLLAWERMPVRTHISAVFDLALDCVDNLGADGSDDDTGLGRLDIGCLAYEVTQATECDPGQILTSKGDCEVVVCPEGTSLNAATARCEPIVCEADELLIGSTCVTKAVCPAGQVLDEMDNSCNTLTYWAELQTHQYTSGSESPPQKAFRVAGLATIKAQRSSHAYLLDGGSAGQNAVDLLTRIGVASSQYTYLELAGDLNNVPASVIVDTYAPLASGDLINFSFSTSPFVTDSSTSVGISTQQVEEGAYVLLDTGDDGMQDPLAALPQHFKDGVEAAAATDKVHFYYGLNTGLAGRHASASGCKNIKDYCIGAPYSFTVQLRNDTTVNLSGKASTFAFAAYLLAWERMPVRTHISAVFDLALDCVDDIGADGSDDDTGLGRLDIGCLAYEASQAIECDPGQTLTSKGVCEVVVCPAGQVLDGMDNSCSVPDYWSLLQSHEYAAGVESPLAQAFRVAGLTSPKADRSSDAHILYTGVESQAQDISGFLAGLGVASDRFSYLFSRFAGDLQLEETYRREPERK